ncbi:hypothetical protein TNCV_4365331 [Trichonephila clavipes]|nr:hypothetical protein TNCV_4365331 [Trichonephila clavipes]
MVLKANDRRTSCPCHDEFRGPRSDYVRQNDDKRKKLMLIWENYRAFCLECGALERVEHMHNYMASRD